VKTQVLASAISPRASMGFVRARARDNQWLSF
jgi:hypothetical protein